MPLLRGLIFGYVGKRFNEHGWINGMLPIVEEIKLDTSNTIHIGQSVDGTYEMCIRDRGISRRRKSTRSITRSSSQSGWHTCVMLSSSAVIPCLLYTSTVTFPSVRKTVTRPALFDWSKEEDEKIRYYAGHATYRGLFRWKNEQDGRIILRLGKVANVATVRVNSIACGT